MRAKSGVGMPDLLRFRTSLFNRVWQFGFHLFDLAAYEVLYRFSPARRLMFFNGGYLPVADDLLHLAEITPAEAPNAMMYHLVAATLPGTHLQQPGRVLDVGFGQGGGMFYLSRLFPKARIVGTERNRSAVRLARRRFGAESRLEFRAATGDSLAFAERFDLVISVGAPTYFGLTRFVSQAAATLAPRGVLCFSGGYRQGNHAMIEAEIRAAADSQGLDFMGYWNITPHTFASLKADIPRREKILARVPWPFRVYGEKWADMPGSAEYEEYATGKRTDFAALLIKKA
jgi:SAM-dependent methyltransferase